MRSKTKCLNQPIVLQFIRLLGPGCLTLIISACSGSQEPVANDGSAVKSSSEASDIAIARAVYFDERTPDGFYQESSPGDAYYVTSHIKNIDLLPLVDRAGEPVYELASDDFNESLAWSEQAANFQSSYPQLVDNSETLLYHQFTRVDPAAPEFIYLNRVLKASVLDRNGVNDDYKGRITIATMTTSDIKLIVEYLWTFTINNNYGNAVLSSSTVETASDYVHVLKQAKLNMNVNTGCDTINIYETHYTIPKVSGFIWKEDLNQRVISTKRTGDSVVLCDA